MSVMDFPGGIVEKTNDTVFGDHRSSHRASILLLFPAPECFFPPFPFPLSTNRSCTIRSSWSSCTCWQRSPSRLGGAPRHPGFASGVRRRRTRRWRFSCSRLPYGSSSCVWRLLSKRVVLLFALIRRAAKTILFAPLRSLMFVCCLGGPVSAPAGSVLVILLSALIVMIVVGKPRI